MGPDPGIVKATRDGHLAVAHHLVSPHPRGPSSSNTTFKIS